MQVQYYFSQFFFFLPEVWLVALRGHHHFSFCSTDIATRNELLGDGKQMLLKDGQQLKPSQSSENLVDKTRLILT